MLALIVFVMGVAGFITLRRENRMLRGEIDALRDELRTAPVSRREVFVEPARPTKTAPALPVADASIPEPTERVEPIAPPMEPAFPRVPLTRRFEQVVGGNLPIWIGAVAFVFAGVFLVRFSIEQGWFGPTARCIAAALFGLALVAVAQLGPRIGPVARILSDDRRLEQALAGAGIAILYSTIYMASESYALLGVAAAFVGVAAVTALAFWLSLRHGPPTALMGLVGGFAAPLVAGLGPAAMAPTVGYLTIFSAGLFALAIRRGWTWLALAATGGGFAWSLALIVLGASDVAQTLVLPGLFVAGLAIAATVTLEKLDQDVERHNRQRQLRPAGQEAAVGGQRQQRGRHDAEDRPEIGDEAEQEGDRRQHQRQRNAQDPQADAAEHPHDGHRRQLAGDPPAKGVAHVTQCGVGAGAAAGGDEPEQAAPVEVRVARQVEAGDDQEERAHRDRHHRGKRAEDPAHHPAAVAAAGHCAFDCLAGLGVAGHAVEPRLLAHPRLGLLVGAG